MNLDDRLRSAQRKQVEAIDSHLRAEGLDRPPAKTGRPNFGPGLRWGFLAATAAVVALVAVFAIPQLTSNPEAVSTADEVNDESTDSSPTTVDDSPTTTTDNSGNTTDATGTTAPVAADSTDGTAAGDANNPNNNSDDSDRSEQSATSTTATTQHTATTPNTATTEGSNTSTVTLAVPKPTTVCPSGYRAPLELAGVVYLSDDIGWDRKDDLIDEQDALYYFNTWEPNYSGVVQVEVIMPEPVLATDLRVAQDPITEVSGVIDAEAAGQAIRFELEGLAGWQVYNFGEPTLLDRFTLTRSEAGANIVEVMVCVDRP